MCLSSREARSSSRFYGTRVIDSCERLCGYWKPSRGPLPKHHVLLSTGPSRQSHSHAKQCSLSNAMEELLKGEKLSEAEVLWRKTFTSPSVRQI